MNFRGEREFTSSSSSYYDTTDCWTDETHATLESPSRKNVKSMVTPDTKSNRCRTYKIVELNSQDSLECLNSASFKSSSQSVCSDTYKSKKTNIAEQFNSLDLNADVNKDNDSIKLTSECSMSTILAGNSTEKSKQRRTDDLLDSNLNSIILAGRLISADESNFIADSLERNAVEDVSLMNEAIALPIKEVNDKVQDNTDNILELNILESTQENSTNDNVRSSITDNLINTIDLSCTDNVEVLSSDKSVTHFSSDAEVQEKECSRVNTKNVYLTHGNSCKKMEDVHLKHSSEHIALQQRNDVACKNVVVSSRRKNQQSNNFQKESITKSVTDEKRNEPTEKSIESLPSEFTSHCTTFNRIDVSRKRDTNHNIQSNSNDSASASECNFESVCTKSEVMATACIKSPIVKCIPFIEDCHTSTPVQAVIQNTFGSIDESTILKSFNFLKQCHSPFEKYIAKNACETKGNVPESKSGRSPEKLIRRLSQDFSNSPRKFTERLVTIIEESAVHTNCDSKDFSGVSLRRITEEFRKICKRIEDESMPEWAPSLIHSPSKREVGSNKSSCHKTSNIENGNCSIMETSAVECGKLKRDEHVSQCVKCAAGKPLVAASPPKNLQKLNNDKGIRSKTPKSISMRDTNVSKSPFCKNDSHHATENNSRSKKCAIEDKCCKMNDTDAFLIWEDICNVFYDANKNNSNNIQEKSTSLDSLDSSKNDVMIICERQMASLDDTMTQKIKSEVITDSLTSQQDNVKISQTNLDRCYELQSTPPCHANQSSDLCSGERKESKNPQKMQQLPTGSQYQTCNLEQVKSSNHDGYLEIYEDELEKSLLLELAEKRQRCFDMAEKMLEIRDDPVVAQAKKSLENFPELQNVSSSSCDNDARFFNTLTSCMDYHTYITNKSRPLHDILQRLEHVEKSIFHSHDDTLKRPIETSLMKKIFSTKTSTGGATESTSGLPIVMVTEASPVPTLNEKVNLLKLRDMMSPEIDINCAKKLTYTPRKTPERKYFFTPGKSPTYGKMKKKSTSYFSSPKSTRTEKLPPNVTKSLHTRGLYRSNYNTVLSPVGMYIKGTDVSFIRNITTKTNKKLLTPKEKSKETLSKVGLSIKSPKISSARSMDSLKFKLSPQQDCKQEKQQKNQSSKRSKITTSPVTGIKNIPSNNFALPKIAYKQARQEYTINKVPEPPQGRIRGLLQSRDDKVVVRHEARIKVQCDKKKKKVVAAANTSVPESLISDSADFSLHVEKIAQKTNFVGRKKAC